MRALQFVQKLQETLNEVAENGSNRALFVVLDYDLVAQVRSYAYNHLEGQSISSANRATHTFISDLMSRDIFNSRIRYCIAKLQEFSMPSAQYFDLISQAIDVYLRSDHRSIHRDRQALNARVALLAEIARCFESWYRPDDIFFLDFAVEHCLCLRKSRERQWQITTLGRYILELPPFETIVTILASEVALSQPQRQQNRFVNRQLLRDLQSSQTHFRGSLPYSLRMFDLVGEPEHGSQAASLTPLGERVIDTVLQSDDRLQDLILVMLESEVEGLHMFSQHSDEHIQASLEATSLLAFDDKESVKRAATLARTGAYVDALRLLFPLVERVVDTTIKQVGLSNSGSGMAKKVSLLESQGILSHETAGFAEITAARNKVAHGNIGRNDHQLLRPLFEFSFGYLERLVQEAEAALSRGVTATNL